MKGLWDELILDVHINLVSSADNERKNQIHSKETGLDNIRH
jgi:hypothetical protein